MAGLHGMVTISSVGGAHVFVVGRSDHFLIRGVASSVKLVFWAENGEYDGQQNETVTNTQGDQSNKRNEDGVEDLRSAEGQWQST